MWLKWLSHQKDSFWWWRFSILFGILHQSLEFLVEHTSRALHNQYKSKNGRHFSLFPVTCQNCAERNSEKCVWRTPYHVANGWEFAACNVGRMFVCFVVCRCVCECELNEARSLRICYVCVCVRACGCMGMCRLAGWVSVRVCLLELNTPNIKYISTVNRI